MTTDAPQRTPATEMEALAAALGREAELIGGLAGALEAQRAAVASGDVAMLQQKTDALSQALTDLEQARVSRRKTLAGLCGRGEMRLSQLEQVLPVPLHPAVTTARELLVRATKDAAREMTINQTVLRRATEQGQALVERILSRANHEAPAYRPSVDRASRPVRSPVLVNRIG
jgi:hypothetical protein